jgi:hypothetical protein
VFKSISPQFLVRIVTDRFCIERVSVADLAQNEKFAFFQNVFYDDPLMKNSIAPQADA